MFIDCFYLSIAYCVVRCRRLSVVWGLRCVVRCVCGYVCCLSYAVFCLVFVVCVFLSL